MWYDASRTGIEALKAVLSVAVLWGGTVVSGATVSGPSSSFDPGPAGDVVGVWTWVVDGSPRRPEAGRTGERFVEFRRAGDGSLLARALVREGRNAVIREIPDVSFEAGRLCLTLGDGIAFRGTMRADGRSIDGIVRLEDSAAAALLLRLDTRRRHREPAPLRAT